MSTKKQIPAVEGLFTWPSKDPRLLATKCKTCGNVRFPTGSTCNNPYCTNKTNVEDVQLSKRGKVFSCMIEHYEMPGTRAPKPFKPYGVALVELPDGIRVVGMVVGCDIKDIKVGMDVELVVEKL
jgi:uncharacterized OB-fold protein